MKKEEYEGEFADDIAALEGLKLHDQHNLGALMCPDYEWQKDVDDYETHLNDIQELEHSIRYFDSEIRKFKRLLDSSI
jgi:hypothetical protein